MKEKTKVFKWYWILMGILVFGAIWALVEVVLGGALRFGNFPYRGALLTGIGMGAICGMALAIFRKPVMIIGIGIIAALIKLLIIPVQNVPVACMANSSLAVSLEAIALSAVSLIFIKTMNRSVRTQILAGASGAFIGSMLFWSIGMYVAPCKYLLSFAGSPGRWMVTESLLWAVFSAVLLPIGYLAGTKIFEKINSMVKAKPLIVYANSISIFIVSVGICALAYYMGL